MKLQPLALAGVLHEFGIRTIKRPADQGRPGRFIVDDPRKLMIHGLRGVRRGDEVEVTMVRTGIVQATHVRTGKSITKGIATLLGRGSGPAFRR